MRKKTNILLLSTLICVLISICNCILLMYTAERIAFIEWRARQAEQAVKDIRAKFVIDYQLRGE